MERVHLLLDYDGTLVPFAAAPELAVPDEPLLTLLAGLAASPRIDVEMVSGRVRETLERWFTPLPMALWAEHGFWFRPANGREWRAQADVDLKPLRRCVPILERFAGSTPGARLEPKTASIAWHYRSTPDDVARHRTEELRRALADVLRQELEILEGDRVIEVRVRGVSKAAAAHRLEAQGVSATVIAFGDDETDEELFAALPPSAVTIAVGRSLRHARFFLEDYRAVRHALGMLLTGAASLSLGPPGFRNA